MNNQAREAKLRRDLKSNGFILAKSRARYWSNDNQLGYMILDGFSGRCITGMYYELELDDVECWLAS